MLIASLPSDEDLRLIDLASYNLMDAPPEKDFDELVELASQLCGFPISLITLLDKDRQWFMARRGVEEQESSRDISFCAHAILHDEVMVVENAENDERFCDNPMVTGEMHVRFYAGAPIVSPTGHKLGTICLIDHKPNTLSKPQERALTILSNQVTRLLDLRARRMVIEDRAKELLQLNNQAFRQAVKEQDNERQFIATELHENMAQVLAASRLYLGMAEDNEAMRLDFIRKANDQLGKLLDDMRGLSNSISPSTLRTMPLEGLLIDVIRQLSQQHHFSIDLQIAEDTEKINFEQSLTCIRIIEKWVQLLQHKKSVTDVSIHIALSTDLITLLIRDNGSRDSFKELEQQVVTSMVYGRVVSQGGIIGFSSADPLTNELSVKLPLQLYTEE